MLDGTDTFIKIEMEDMYYPVVKKVNYLTKNMNKQFKENNIRGFTIEKTNKNLYSYMKYLAFKKYRKNHLVKIIRKNNIEIFGENELKKLRRAKSHKLPFHRKAYHILIYRNLDNYKYYPYLFPLIKEEKSYDNLLSYSEKRARKKKRKRIFIDKYLETKIQSLKKIKENLKDKASNLRKSKILIKSNSSINNTNIYHFNKLLINNWNNQRKRIQGSTTKFSGEKSNLMSTDNLNNINSVYEETTTNYKSNLMNSIYDKKRKKILLPKIGQECLTTLKNLNKINNKLKNIKGENKQNEKDNEAQINDNNLLNLNLPQLYKLFYIKNRKKSKLKIIKKRNTLNLEQKQESYIKKDIKVPIIK